MKIREFPVERWMDRYETVCRYTSPRPVSSRSPWEHGGMSKVFSLAGLRLGWIEGPPALLRYRAGLISEEFCVRLIDATGVMLTPGSALDVEGYLRIG